MPVTTVKSNRQTLHALILKLFFYARAIFGLCLVLDRSKKGVPLLLIVQRAIACIWFVLYVASAIKSKKVEFAFELDIKSSLIVNVLPVFIQIMLSVSMCLTLLFTHYFADERKGLIREVKSIDPTLNTQNLRLHPRGANLMVAVAGIQTFYIAFWFLLTGPINYYKNVTLFENIIGIIPRFVAIFFLMDYVTGSATLIQQFIRNNESLQLLQSKSLQSLQYPENESLFREQLTKISDRHRQICGLVKRTNRIYSLQLFVNIGLLYAFLITKAYITVYAILLSAEPEIRTKIIVVNLVHLFVNAATLVLLVETSARLCQEAERTKTILWSIRVAETREESMNQMSCCSFQIAYNKVEIWAFSMFKVDYQLIFTVVSSISTYLFLMFQYELYS